MNSVNFGVNRFNCLIANFMTEEFDCEEHEERFFRSDFEILFCADLMELFNELEHM